MRIEAETRLAAWAEEHHPTWAAITEMTDDNWEVDPSSSDRRDPEFVAALVKEMRDRISMLDRNVKLPGRALYGGRERALNLVRIAAEKRYKQSFALRFIERCLEEKRSVEARVKAGSEADL